MSGPVQGPALPSESTVHFVLDLALRIGEVQMSSGAGASDATATIIAVANAYGLPHCEVDVIFTSITVACHRGVDLPPITSLRVVRSRGLDYTRLALVEQLVRDITRGHTTARDAHAELDRITSAPHPYPRWAATLAYAGMAAAITILIGGGGLVAVFACFALASYATPRAVVVAGVAGGTGAIGYSALALTSAGPIAASAVAATVIGFSGGVLSRRLRIPPLVIAVSGMVPLLPGLTTYRALFELAVERNYTGLSTLMVATLVALALAAGVVLGEYLAQPVRYGLGRLERRLSGPRMAGPLRPTRRRME